jgi:hypothetical protein
VIAQEERNVLSRKATVDCSGTNVPLGLWVSTMGLSYFRGTAATWCHSLWKHHWMRNCEVEPWMTAWVFKFVELCWQSVNGQPRFCLSRSPSEQFCLLLVAGPGLGRVMVGAVSNRRGVVRLPGLSMGICDGNCGTGTGSVR